MKKETKKVVGKRKSQPKIYKDTTPVKISTKGNELWQMAARRVGRPYRFQTASDLWNIACEYFDWCVNNPIIEIDYKGKDATPVEMAHPRPFTLRALCIFAGVNEVYINDLEVAIKKRLEQGDDLEAKEFSQTLTHIRDICFSQKFDNAMVGLYNPMIASRDLGLSEKTDTTLNMTAQTQIVMIDDSGNKIEIE